MSTFNGELNNYLDNVRREHEQIIDSINLDTIIKSEWDTTSLDKAISIVKDFEDYLELHKDEIKALVFSITNLIIAEKSPLK